MTKISVIIPTHNRKETLKKCLSRLGDQTCGRSDREVIVIDDGSTDGTEDVVRTEMKDAVIALRYFRQNKRGPAAARNVGIGEAKGEIVLFLGDDIMAAPTLLEEHLSWHERYSDDNVAVLGLIKWSPETKITPFMKWLEDGGPQFAFWEIENKTDVDAMRYFYSSNVSIKKKFLLENKAFFDEDFPYAAYEDAELAFRLKAAGMAVKYNKDAVGYHYHYTSLDDACRRMVRVGYSRRLLAKKTGEMIIRHPKRGISRMMSALKFAFFYILARFYEKRAVKKHLFAYVLEHHYHKGFDSYQG